MKRRASKLRLVHPVPPASPDMNKATRKAPPRLKRTLRRGCTMRPIEEGDLRLMFAAYRAGKDWGEAFPEGMTPADFIGRFNAIASQFSERITFVAKTARGETPCGFLMATEDGHRVWPHAHWFPWASGRNKLECIAAYLRREGRAGRVPLIAAETKDKGFFEHLARYGVLRRIGTIHQYFADGSPAAFFQGREV